MISPRENTLLSACTARSTPFPPRVWVALSRWFFLFSGSKMSSVFSCSQNSMSRSNSNLRTYSQSEELMPTAILFSEWTKRATTARKELRLLTFSKKVSASRSNSQRWQGERMSTRSWQRSTPLSISFSDSVLKQSSMFARSSNSTLLNSRFRWLFEYSFSIMVLLSLCRLTHSSTMFSSCSPFSGRSVTSIGTFFSTRYSSRHFLVCPPRLRKAAVFQASSCRLSENDLLSSYSKVLASSSRACLLEVWTSMAMRSSMGMWQWSGMFCWK